MSSRRQYQYSSDPAPSYSSRHQYSRGQGTADYGQSISYALGNNDDIEEFYAAGKLNDPYPGRDIDEFYAAKSDHKPYGGSHSSVASRHQSDTYSGQPSAPPSRKFSSHYKNNQVRDESFDYIAEYKATQKQLEKNPWKEDEIQGARALYESRDWHGPAYEAMDKHFPRHNSALWREKLHDMGLNPDKEGHRGAESTLQRSGWKSSSRDHYYPNYSSPGLIGYSSNSTRRSNRDKDSGSYRYY